MKQTINIKVNEGRINGTIYDPARVTAQVLATFGTGGGGMDGEFTAITFTPHSPTLDIASIDSDKVKCVVNTGYNERVRYLGTAKAGTFKLLWISLVQPSTVTFQSTSLGTEGIFQTGLMVGVTEIEYTRTFYADYLFMCTCLGGNQWLVTEVSGLANTAIGWQNALLDYVEKETGKSLVSDTEIAKIHSQNTDNQLKSLDGGTIVSVEDLATIMDLTHQQNTDTILDDGGANEVSAEELRGVVDFANISTPPAAYQIPVVQDITGVKSLKYSADFVFENGTLKVKGAGNTTGKTLSLFNLAGTENVTVLDSGNVGIGILPNEKLSVNGVIIGNGVYSVIFPGIIRFRPQSPSNSIGEFTAQNTGEFTFKNNTGATFVNFKGATGLCGINTTTPAKSLEVSNATGDCFRLSYDKSTTYKADFTLDSSGNLTIAPAGRTNITGDLNANGVLIDGTQVLSEQQAAIADATDNTTAISQLNLLLNAARAHGLIAT